MLSVVKLNPEIKEFKEAINEWVWDQTSGVVASGPFKGMQLIKEQSWCDGNLGNKCLGCYEAELHTMFEEEIKRLSTFDNPKIVNIGCAEGYYAVGLARRLPKATVWAVDKDPEASRLTQQAASLNGVSVTINGVLGVFMDTPDLVVVDCEGAEVEYLNVDEFPDLKKANIIVETHDFPNLHTANVLYERFKVTHEIFICRAEGIRNPTEFELLDNMSSHVKWLLMSEGRPCSQYFLYMKPL